MEPVVIVGAGLAGSEAAWQILRMGGNAVLMEMKPEVFSPAHRLPGFAEVVCSNSFKSESLENAVGILKEEMRQLDSLILKAAQETRVPAGQSLAVDREVFSNYVTQQLEQMENLKVIRKEVRTIPEAKIVVLATGPLTSEPLSQEIQKIAGSSHLFFYDAISPIVTAESVDGEKVFMASRYGKGGDDFVNCPLEEREYYALVEALRQAERVPVRDFEKRYLFEGCLPIEELADRGKDTLAFGPLKPVGFVDPTTGKQPFAVVQLRREDRFGSCYNLVGFQTRLKQDEQKRVFQMIPGLERAEFVRWGSVHRNTFIDSPRLLLDSLQFRRNPRLFFAGQMTGVEGYMESTAMGLLAGINAFRLANGLPRVVPPPTTAMGALVHYIVHTQAVPFQPMNANFGLLPTIKGSINTRKQKYCDRSIQNINQFLEII